MISQLHGLLFCDWKHSSVSYAERHVLTGQSNAYVDSEQHTVLIARWRVNLSIAGMFLLPTLCTSVKPVYGLHFQPDQSNLYEEVEKI